MTGPKCPYVTQTGAREGKFVGEGGRSQSLSQQPCFLFARKLHSDSLEALLRVLPAGEVPYLGWGPNGGSYSGWNTVE